MNPADELRTAANTLRSWADSEPPTGWAPSAITAFGPSLAEWLDFEAHLMDQVPGATLRGRLDRALDAARLINGTT